MAQFTYPSEQRKRGASMKTLGISCYILFSFFLLAGFWGMAFVPYAFVFLTAVCLLFFCYGTATARAGKGRLDFYEDGILWHYGRRKLFIPFDVDPSVTFGGVFYKKLILTGDGTVISVYRTLTDYPAFWRELKRYVAVPVLPDVDLTVPCRKTDGLGVFVSAAVLLLAALIALAKAYAVWHLAAGSLVIVSILFGIVLAVIIVLAVSKLGSVTFGREELVWSTPLKKRAVPVAGLTDVALEQARVRMLITGYRYRGPALPAQAAVSAAGLGLSVRLTAGGETLTVDETQTSFPLELLYDYLRSRYGLPEAAGGEQSAASGEQSAAGGENTDTEA